MSSTIDFILGDGPSALPGEACYHAKRSLLDLIGVWAAARDSDTSRIIYDHAAATLAMVEAYGLTQSPIFRGSARKALDFVLLLFAFSSLRHFYDSTIRLIKCASTDEMSLTCE